MSKKSAISGIFLAVGLAALGAKGYADRVEKEKLEKQQLEDIPVESLNGEFYCEYYKAKTQVLSNVYSYETIATQSGWNWVFELHDGTAVFYTQTAGQFCYVIHVEEE